MSRVLGTWTGEERETLSAGIVRPGDQVSFPQRDAESFEAQGLFKPEPPKREKKQAEEVKHVRSDD